jgi:mannose-6-phosphate isomerase class I
MWGSLTPEQGLEVFDYTGVTLAELHEKVAPSNRILFKSENLEILELIGKTHTNSFGLWKVKIKKESDINLPRIVIVVVAKGNGKIIWDKKEKTISQSDYFFKPHKLNNITFRTENEIELLICLPPET